MARISTLRRGAGIRLTDLVGLGALTRCIPLARVHEALKETGRESQRQRDLPAHVMVYLVIALGLYRELAVEEVLRRLIEGLKQLVGVRVRVETAGKSGITAARQRLGELPLKHLYEMIVQPVATAETKGAWFRDWLVVAVDGTTLEVPDSEANRAEFGLPYAQRGESAYPRLRITGLVETGTHVHFAAQVGPYSTGEVTMAREIVKQLKPGMLCLADRYFYGFALWEQARAQGAELVWRVRSNIRLPCQEVLKDGSFLSRIYPPREKGRPRGEGVAVRVLEYWITNDEGKKKLYRLITTILDPDQVLATELIQLYLERWEFETALDEWKTHLRGARTVLRSQTPELIRQECYGLLLAHFALRGMMHEAALQGGRDPDRLSFIHAVRVVHRSMPRFAALSPRGSGSGFSLRC
jgi:Insertion element 4 transposase N-terminal/Transposase DDE domain